MATDLYLAEKALYSTTDPNGPDAGKGTVTTEAAGANFQICGDNGTIPADVAKKLGIIGSGLVKPFSREQALAENDARNKATYGTANAAGRVANVEPAPAPEPVKDDGDGKADSKGKPQK